MPLGEEDGSEWFACPRQDLRERPDEWAEMLLYYGMYRKGFLPDRGAVSEQSNFAVEVFRLFDEQNALIDEELEAERRRKEER